jgi:hypothetical protein
MKEDITPQQKIFNEIVNKFGGEEKETLTNMLKAMMSRHVDDIKKKVQKAINEI